MQVSMVTCHSNRRLSSNRHASAQHVRTVSPIIGNVLECNGRNAPQISRLSALSIPVSHTPDMTWHLWFPHRGATFKI